MDKTDQAIERSKKVGLSLMIILFEISLFILVSWKFISVIGYFEVWSMFPLILLYFLVEGYTDVELFFLISKKRILLIKEKQEKHKEFMVVNNGKNIVSLCWPLHYV